MKTIKKLKGIVSGLLVLLLGACMAPTMVILLDLSLGYYFQSPAKTSEKIQLFKNLLSALGQKPSPFYAVEDASNASHFQSMLVLPFDYRDYTYEPQPGFPKYDSQKRRLSVSPPNKISKDHFNIFFGGSFLYGDGVVDEFTLPSQIQTRLNNYQSYNYCMEGGSPVHALTLAARRQLASQIPQKSGNVFFEVTGSSFGRVRGTPANVSWLKDLPYVDLNSKEQLGLRGTLSETSPTLWFLMSWARLSVLTNFINLQENDWEVFFPDQTERLCRIIVETKKLVSEQLIVEGFYVLAYGLKEKSSSAITSCLEKNNIKLFTLSFNKKDSCQSKFRAEHPSEVAHSESADYLIYQLNLWPAANKAAAPNLNFSCVVAR